MDRATSRQWGSNKRGVSSRRRDSNEKAILPVTVDVKTETKETNSSASQGFDTAQQFQGVDDGWMNLWDYIQHLSWPSLLPVFYRLISYFLPISLDKSEQSTVQENTQTNTGKLDRVPSMFSSQSQRNADRPTTTFIQQRIYITYIYTLFGKRGSEMGGDGGGG